MKAFYIVSLFVALSSVTLSQDNVKIDNKKNKEKSGSKDNPEIRKSKKEMDKQAAEMDKKKYKKEVKPGRKRENNDKEQKETKKEEKKEL